jgi:uncharacterized membrane protein YidH (DUF202 family)
VTWARRKPLPPPPMPASATTEDDFALERYRYILQQIHTINENVYRFLAIYQTLAVAIVGGGLALFVGYRKWQIATSVARTGIIGLMWLVTVVAAFAGLLIVMGALNWWDYRKEECELTDAVVRPGFRKQPRLQNLFRWYETYIVLFIVGSIAFLWAYTLAFILPAMK